MVRKDRYIVREQWILNGNLNPATPRNYTISFKDVVQGNL
jgi:hypothetical protein